MHMVLALIWFLGGELVQLASEMISSAGVHIPARVNVEGLSVSRALRDHRHLALKIVVVVADA
jgi:hypothetical protein